jgi:hypothetical protein
MLREKVLGHEVINLEHLKQNKKAANRPKDQDDLLNLP